MVEETADPANGKEIFQQTRGGCHTLREAGTNGSNPVQNPSSGPNLDDAFAASREERVCPRHDRGGGAGADRLPGATDAGGSPERRRRRRRRALRVPGRCQSGCFNRRRAQRRRRRSEVDVHEQLWLVPCAGEAGTSGAVGPNLDEAQPTFEKAVRQITNGEAACRPSANSSRTSKSAPCPLRLRGRLTLFPAERAKPVPRRFPGARLPGVQPRLPGRPRRG